MRTVHVGVNVKLESGLANRENATFASVQMRETAKGHLCPLHSR